MSRGSSFYNLIIKEKHGFFPIPISLADTEMGQVVVEGWALSQCLITCQMQVRLIPCLCCNVKVFTHERERLQAFFFSLVIFFYPIFIIRISCNVLAHPYNLR